MPARFVFEFGGEDQVDRTLLNLSLHAADARPAWRVIINRLRRAERAQFASEGAYGSGGWAPLSAAYAAAKARSYPGKPILERTGRLVKSLTRKTSDTIEDVDPRYMVFGTSVPYARYHQNGTEYMPRRRPVELPEVERRAVVKVLQRYLVTGNPT